MDKNQELLNAESAPNQLKAGVRRANNIPKYIVMSIILAFALMIALSALSRAQKQHQPVKAPQDEATAKTYRAREVENPVDSIIGPSLAGIVPTVPPKVANDAELVLPVAVVANPDAPPLPGHGVSGTSAPVAPAEPSPFQQKKLQELEEAVKAKMAVGFDREALRVSMQNTGRSEVSSSGNLTRQFRQKLQAMQARSGQGQALNAVPADAKPSRWDLEQAIEHPKSPFSILAGAVIPGKMISGIRSELPGQVIGQVSETVYDSATGKYPLIPQGTKTIGVYVNDISYGQESIMIAWQRLEFPDGKSLDIGAMPGADSAGYTGFRGKVDNHYLRIFGSAILMSAIVGGVTYSQNQNQATGYFTPPTAGAVMSQALGQQLGEVATQMISKNLNIAPTLSTGPGYEFNIILVKDLVFDKPYQAFDYK